MTDKDALARLAEAGDVSAMLDMAFAADAAGRRADAVCWMDRAAGAGDAKVRLQAALWQLYGSNYTRDEAAAFCAIETLGRDAREPQARRLTAVMLAFGMGCRRDWSAAIDLMTQASDAGDALAKTDLAMLSGGNSVEISDPASWQAPPPETLLTRPRVDIYRSVIPPEWCRHIIDQARPHLAQAHVKDARTGQRTVDPMRTNSVTLIELWDYGLVHYAVAARLATACRTAIEKLEPPKILRYQPGQTYKAHFDFIDPDVPAFARELREKGQRTKTPLVYLNDAYAGGDTRFLSADMSFRGQIGDLLVLRNTRAGGKPDRDSLHAGLPPTQGEKWVYSTRVRTRPQIARLWREF